MLLYIIHPSSDVHVFRRKCCIKMVQKNRCYTEVFSRSCITFDFWAHTNKFPYRTQWQKCLCSHRRKFGAKLKKHFGLVMASSERMIAREGSGWEAVFIHLMHMCVYLHLHWKNSLIRSAFTFPFGKCKYPFSWIKYSHLWNCLHLFLLISRL